MNTEYGPLPEPELKQGRYGYRMCHVDYFTADQLRDFGAEQVAAANARLADVLGVLQMVDDNNRVDAGEDRKAWRGDFVVAEVRRVLGGA